MTRLAVVFDWDGVIFDGGVVRKVRAKAMEKLGVVYEHLEETARIAKGKRKGYNFGDHAKLLAKGTALKALDLERSMYRALEKHPGDFVFADTRNLIKVLKRGRYAIDVLTAGHKEFQEYKIERSRLGRLFRNVHIVPAGEGIPKRKIKALEKIARTHDTVIFLDDRPDTIELVQKTPRLKGKVLPILVWRKKGTPPAGLLAIRRMDWKRIQKIASANGFQAY